MKVYVCIPKAMGYLYFSPSLFELEALNVEDLTFDQI